MPLPLPHTRAIINCATTYTNNYNNVGIIIVIINIIIIVNSNSICIHKRAGDAFFHGIRQQKGLNIAKELGSANPECTLMSKLSPSHLKDVFWMNLSEYQR